LPDFLSIPARVPVPAPVRAGALQVYQQVEDALEKSTP
jgi:hypothetical protein